jgi:hypothetical protein
MDAALDHAWRPREREADRELRLLLDIEEIRASRPAASGRSIDGVG